MQFLGANRGQYHFIYDPSRNICTQLGPTFTSVLVDPYHTGNKTAQAADAGKQAWFRTPAVVSWCTCKVSTCGLISNGVVFDYHDEL